MLEAQSRTRARASRSLKPGAKGRGSGGVRDADHAASANWMPCVQLTAGETEWTAQLRGDFRFDSARDPQDAVATLELPSLIRRKQ
jgi:hypothetical protein